MLDTDESTTVRDLKELVAQFVDERDWQQFHSPKNLSMSIAIESAELMEHFQWLTIDEAKSLGSSQERKSEVAEELADVACYLLAFANSMEIDLAVAIRLKIEKNRKKYPSDKFRGRFGERDDRADPQTSG